MHALSSATSACWPRPHCCSVVSCSRRQRRRKSEKPARAPEAVGPEWYAEQRLAKRMSASLLPLGSSVPMQLRRPRSKSRADFPAADRAASAGAALAGAALALDSKGSSRVCAPYCPIHAS